MSIKGFFTGGRWIGISVVAVVAAVGLQATAAHAADGFQLPMNGSVISGFAVQSDLARTTAGSSAVVIPAARARTSTTSTMARQSVPDRDRAASYRGGELFANSKTVLPLLVADLQPRLASTARPMSGRSVGARPAAPWTRTPLSVVTPAPARSTGPSTGVAWADLR
jgi:hypothetical protein